jgi:CheY-like chemotaxis protein
MARVLIVEPHPDVRDSFAAVCETWGHEVAAIGDGRDALALLRGFKPDVVLLDLGLPGGLDGAAVAERIRSAEGDRVFIIALTGWAPPNERAKALQAGANAFFLKPPDLKQLQKTIARASDRLTKQV